MATFAMLIVAMVTVAVVILAMAIVGHGNHYHCERDNDNSGPKATPAPKNREGGGASWQPLLCQSWAW